MSKKKIEKKKLCVALFFLSFYIVIFSITWMLMQGRNTRKKDIIMFLGHLWGFVWVGRKFWFRECDFSGLSVSHPQPLHPPNLVLDGTHLVILTFTLSHWTPTHHKSTWIPCSQGNINTLCKWGVMERGTHSACFFCLCTGSTFPSNFAFKTEVPV